MESKKVGDLHCQSGFGSLADTHTCDISLHHLRLSNYLFSCYKGHFKKIKKMFKLCFQTVADKEHGG